MTISDIAKMAGVSSAAVSRYLNGGPLSEQKRAVIHEVVEKTGYRPDTAAQTLRTGKVNQVGVIAPSIGSQSVGQITAGIASELDAKSYLMLLGNTELDAQRELGYLTAMQRNHVAGIILLGSYYTPQLAQALKNCRVPVVVTGQRFQDVACVYNDDRTAARDLAQREINALEDYQRRLREEGVSGDDAMDRVRAWFREEVDRRAELGKTCGDQMDNAFRFLEQAFGQGQSQPGRTPALGFQSRPPARGQAGPAVIAFLGIEQIGGQAQVETARRRFAQRQIAPTGRGGQQGLEIGHHQPPGRLQPGAEHVHAPGPAVFRRLRRLGQRIAHGQMRRLLGTLRPDQGHMAARAVRQGGDIRKFRGQRFFNGIQQAHLRARAGLGPRDAAG